MSGWNPPPAPGGPPGGGVPYGHGPQPPGYPPGPYGPGGAYVPPPPRRSSSAPLIIGMLAVLAVAVVAVLVVAFMVVGGGPSSISTPATAGGLTRDYAAERELGTQLSSQQSTLRNLGGSNIEKVRTAVYSSGSDRYLFVGGTGDFDPDRLHSEFRRSMDNAGNSSVSVVTIPLADPGGDGEAACASIRAGVLGSSLSYQTATCVWMTDKTFGLVAPAPQTSGSLGSTRTYTYSVVADQMRRLRKDVES
ncbi:hypothetical protein [Actinomadura keratinilytica]|uniref:Uncharacterized protein n=1 Tax=Actinomadura keratinilytica TaxID=547461 RepID=A0ABP7Z2D3_9ACTN